MRVMSEIESIPVIVNGRKLTEEELNACDDREERRDAMRRWRAKRRPEPSCSFGQGNPRGGKSLRDVKHRHAFASSMGAVRIK